MRSNWNVAFVLAAAAGPQGEGNIEYPLIFRIGHVDFRGGIADVFYNLVNSVG